MQVSLLLEKWKNYNVSTVGKVKISYSVYLKVLVYIGSNPDSA
ncbi:hypothetical protein [Rhizosphaericola mali]|nr:hypothetical protein [Rhizosphaericola mali]